MADFRRETPARDDYAHPDGRLKGYLRARAEEERAPSRGVRARVAERHRRRRQRRV